MFQKNEIKRSKRNSDKGYVMSQKSSFQRLFIILDRLNKGNTICIKQFSEEFEVSDRTIRRDMELIKETWGDIMTKEGDCYRGHKKTILEDLLKGTDLSSLYYALHIIEAGKLNITVDKTVKKLTEKSKEIYLFKNKPFEEIKEKDILSSLEKAIKFKHKITVHYKGNRGISEFDVNPYKILFLNENFYLAGEVDKDEPFILMRISLIEAVELKSDTFYKDNALAYFIDNVQTPWAKFTKKPRIKIVTEVDKSIIKYFEMKKYLPSQRMGKKLENRNTIVTFEVDSIKEFHELAIKWMPKMKILHPQKVKNSVKKELMKKLTGI